MRELDVDYPDTTSAGFLESKEKEIGVSGKKDLLKTYALLVFREQRQKKVKEAPEICFSKLMRFMTESDMPRMFRDKNAYPPIKDIFNFADYQAKCSPYTDSACLELQPNGQPTVLIFNSRNQATTSQAVLNTAVRRVKDSIKKYQSRANSAKNELKLYQEILRKERPESDAPVRKQVHNKLKIVSNNYIYHFLHVVYHLIRID